MSGLTSKEKEGYAQGVELLLIIAILLLVFHFLWFCHEIVVESLPIRGFIYTFLTKLHRQFGLFNTPILSKILTYFLIFLYSLGSKGKIDPNVRRQKIMADAAMGTALFMGSIFLLFLKVAFSPILIDTLYIIVTLVGTLFLIKSGQHLSRLLFAQPENDIFNESNEEFPQNEAFVSNEFSIHFKTTYHYRGKWREGLVNIVNPFRSTMVLGVPGSGKSYAILIPALWQSIYKGYTAYVYDFKFPDLTEEAYNAYLKTLRENKFAWGKKANGEPIIPKFYVINFDDIEYSHRCNPLLPELMTDVMDAYESAQTIMLNLNRTWAQKQGEFFPESAINFLTSVIWYLRTVSMKYRELYEQEKQKNEGEQSPKLLEDFKRLGQICTFPHTLEFTNRRYDETFQIMEQYLEVEIYVRPFIDAKAGGAMEQLEGQISGTAFSLYTSRMMKLVNKKGKLKSALFWDELPTMFIKGIDMLIATARSNKVATWLGIQDFEQLVRDYGEREAKVIINIIGNLFSGTVVFETAEKLSRRFGRTNQEKESITYSKNDTTINVSTQQADVIPSSKISTLKQGEFVGQFVDNFGEEFDLKTFKAFVSVEKDQLKKTQKLPKINDLAGLVEKKYDVDYQKLTESEKLSFRNRLLQEHYHRVKQDISLLIEYEMAEYGITTASATRNH